MAAEQEKGRDARKVVPEHPPGKEHNPPTISPYASQAVTVSIGTSGKIFTLLQAIVDQFSGLKKRIDPRRPDRPIELPEVDEDVGHTLICFIYTSRYETMGLDSIPDDARAIAEFKRSVLAYCAAMLCGIGSLAEVTKEKMEDFSADISVFDLQDVVNEVSAKLPRDEWFPEQLHKWIKSKLVADDSMLMDGQLLDVIGKSTLFDKAVVKSVTEMYAEQVARNKPLVNGGHGKIEQAVEPEPREAESSPKAEVNDSEQMLSKTLPAISELQIPLHTVKPAEHTMRGAQITKTDTPPAQGRSDLVNGHSEETIPAETPSENDVEMSPVRNPKPVLEEALEAHHRINGLNGEAMQAENLKATDSDGESSKVKSAKKSKKKKRKDSVSAVNV